MNSNKTLRSGVFRLSLLAVFIGLAGCRDTGPKNTEFFTQDEVQSLSATLDRQTADGARHDAMLREQHFDGSRLNALGRTKLDHMLLEPGTMTIYLPDTLDKDSLEARRVSIVAFAKDRGREDGEIRVLAGVNPETLHPAGPDVTRITKTENGSLPDKGSGGNDSQITASDLGAPGGGSSGASGGAKTGG